MPRKRRFYLKEDLKFDNSSKLNYCNFVRTRRNSSLQCTFLYSVSLRFQSHLSHWTLAIKWWIRTDSWWHEDTNWDSIISLKNDFSKKNTPRKCTIVDYLLSWTRYCVCACACLCVCVRVSVCLRLHFKHAHLFRIKILILIWEKQTWECLGVRNSGDLNNKIVQT